MRFSVFTTVITTCTFATAQATYTGFNYGSTFTDGSNKQQSDFEDEFTRAKSLLGTNGEFTSARLYTMIQGGTTDTPTSAIPAAIDTQTTLLLGLWASAGQADFSNELTALTSAIDQYGASFTSLVAGISVGSEDLYRISPTGIENDSGAGAEPSDIVNYISQVRSAISGTLASGLSVGHVDTWTAWVNGSNDAVISACDWLGMDAYPYFQTTEDNGISVANSTFFDAYDATVAAADGKAVWITETGWPVSGPTENLAVASIANAETYWQDVACTVLGNINTYWYTLQDADPTTPSPSFGIVGSDLDSAPLYDLTCSNGDVAPSSSAASVVSTASSATQPASASGSNTESLSAASPGPETSPASVSMSQTSAASASATSTNTAPNTSPATPAPTSTAAPSSASLGTASPSPVSSSATTAAAPSGTNCPANLNGEYQYPHLIIPVNSDEPDTAYGTQYNGTVTPSISTIFNFDLPASYAGETCSLVFLFPDQAALISSAFTFNGQGGMTVNELSAPATAQTTFDSVPNVSTAGVGSVLSASPGNSYVITSSSCAAGSTVSFEFESTGGLSLSYFQDSAASPIGAYITVC